MAGMAARTDIRLWHVDALPVVLMFQQNMKNQDHKLCIAPMMDWTDT
jgi:hypothetical protein